LNFGHTIGHAIESVANYKIGHGEAIAIGTVVESYLSHRVGYLSKMEFEEIQKRYEEVGFSLKLPVEYDRKSFMEALSFDKKKSGKSVRFVLIDKIGHAMPFEGAYCRPIPESELEHLLD
jgi:3-dehydroquinate synthase